MDTKRLDIKMLKDGSRTVIVIDGVSPECDKAVLEILNTYYAQAMGNTISKIEGLSSVPADESLPLDDDTLSKMDDFQEVYGGKPSTNKNTIQNGRYKGMTPTQALNQDREVALAALFEYASKLAHTSNERQNIITACKDFMFGLPMMNDFYNTRERKASFLLSVAKMTQLAPFINGYQDLTSFTSYATDSEIDTVFKQVLQTLQDRATQ